MFYKSPIINQPQWLMKDLFCVEKIIDFWIIIERSSYDLIDLHIITIYGLFIFKWSYEDKRRNLSTIVLSFDIYVISFTFFNINWSIHWTGLLFLLHYINSYIKAQTIVQDKYDIIIYTIYYYSLYQTFITNQR